MLKKTMGNALLIAFLAISIGMCLLIFGTSMYETCGQEPQDKLSEYKDSASLYTVPSKSNVSISEATQIATYYGTKQSFAIVGTSLTGFTIQYYLSGTDTETEPINAGTYKVKVTRAEDDNYYSFSTEISEGLIITKVRVTNPQESDKVFVYTGVEQTYTLEPNEYYTVTNNTRTKAGSQTANVVLNDKANYEWRNGEKDDLAFNFTINHYSLIVFANNKSSIQGAELEPLNYSTPFNNFGLDKLSGELATNANKNVPGDYSITIGTLTVTDDNFRIAEFFNNNYTVTKSSVATPGINPDDPNDEGKVDAVVENNERGFNPNGTLIVKNVPVGMSHLDFVVPAGKKIAKMYNAGVVNSVGQRTYIEGTTTVKFAKPSGLPKSKTYTVIMVEHGETVEKTATVEGEYLVFKTSSFGDFAIVVDNKPFSFLWLIILLAVIIDVEIVFIALFIKKLQDNKKTNNIKAYSLNGTLLLLGAFFITSEIIAVIVLGAVAVILGITLLVLALKSRKAKQK